MRILVLIMHTVFFCWKYRRLQKETSRRPRRNNWCGDAKKKKARFEHRIQLVRTNEIRSKHTHYEIMHVPQLSIKKKKF